MVRLTASATTLCPGIYRVSLLRGYDDHAYRFRADEWTTGDAGRVRADRISYDTAANTITVNATGANNVCLMLRYADTDYTIDASQKLLVVRGTGLSTANGASYLWWLNGSNHGTQVKPTATTTYDGTEAQTIIAWDMTQSGLYENFAGQRPSVCMGQTIFGLTSTTGQSVIHDISFARSMDEYLAHTSSVISHTTAGADAPLHATYTVGGQMIGGEGKARHLPSGIYVRGGRKVAIR